jgi:sensor domain CHASE-containing protein
VNPAINILQQPFVQVALPIVIAVTIAAWLQNKRFEDQGRRIDELRSDMNKRLDRIETKLEGFNERITRLEERTALVR